MIERSFPLYKKLQKKNIFFNSLIEYIVEKKYITYQDIEIQTNISKNDIIKSTTEERNLSIDEVKKIAKFLKFNIHIIHDNQTNQICDYILYRNEKSLESILGSIRVYLSEKNESVKENAALLVNILACDIDESKETFSTN